MNRPNHLLNFFFCFYEGNTFYWPLNQIPKILDFYRCSCTWLIFIVSKSTYCTDFPPNYYHTATIKQPQRPLNLILRLLALSSDPILDSTRFPQCTFLLAINYTPAIFVQNSALLDMAVHYFSIGVIAVVRLLEVCRMSECRLRVIYHYVLFGTCIYEDALSSLVSYPTIQVILSQKTIYIILVKFESMKRNHQDFQINLTSCSSSINDDLASPLVENASPSPVKPVLRRSKSKKERYPDPEMQLKKGGFDMEVKKVQKKKQRPKKRFSWPIWKKLFKYSMERKVHFFSSLALNIGFAIIASLLPLKVGQVLDEITKTATDQSAGNMDSLKNNIIVLGIMTFFLAIATFTRFLSLQFLQELLAVDMRNDFYKKFMSFDMYFFEQYKSGQLVSRLTSDVKQAKTAISQNLTFFIKNMVVIAASMCVLFSINTKLTLLVLLIVPFYLIITVYYSRKKKILTREYQDVEAQISALVTEKFSGIQLVKAYGTEDSQVEKYRESIGLGYQITRKKIILEALYNSCSEFLPYMAIMMVLWYGGEMVISGSTQITAGELTSFILYCKSLATSSSVIANSYTGIINGTYAVQKVFQMLDYQPMVNEKEGGERNISGEIQFKNVTFKYPLSSTLALRDLSFKIKDGQYVAFVGQSGSGKSTIIKLIEKFYRIESGNILYGGQDQKDLSASGIRNQIGLVNQEATLFSGNIKDNITYGLDEFTDQEIIDAAERAGCMEFLSNSKRFPMKFLSEVGQKGNQLSGGQRQRVSIARALLRKPKVIIFDEATSALDSNSEHMVKQSIQNLAANSTRADKPTIIVIAHRLSTIINADRIFVMRNGQIQQIGTHRQLRQQGGYYYQLIQKQLEDAPELISPEVRRKGYFPPLKDSVKE